MTAFPGRGGTRFFPPIETCHATLSLSSSQFHFQHEREKSKISTPFFLFLPPRRLILAKKMGENSVSSSISASFNISRISAWRGIEEKGREGFIPRNCAKPSTEISFPRKKVSSGQFASTGNIVEYRHDRKVSIIHRLKFFSRKLKKKKFKFAL